MRPRRFATLLACCALLACRSTSEGGTSPSEANRSPSEANTSPSEAGQSASQADTPPAVPTGFEDCDSARTRLVVDIDDGVASLSGVSPSGEVRWSHTTHHPAPGPLAGPASFRSLAPLCLVAGHLFAEQAYVVDVERGVQATLGMVLDDWVTCDGAVFLLALAAEDQGEVQLHRIEPSRAHISHTVSVPDGRAIACVSGQLSVQTGTRPRPFRTADLGVSPAEWAVPTHGGGLKDP